MRYVPLAYFVMPVFFIVMWTASAITDGTWTFGNNTLSELGISNNPVSAVLFNTGCILTGLVVAISGVIRYKCGERKIISALFTLDGTLLLLIGVFTLDVLPVHMTVAISFCVVSLLLATHTAGALFLKRRHWLAVPLAVGVIFDLVCLIALSFPLAEALVIISSFIWFELLGIDILLDQKHAQTEQQL